MHSNHVFYFFVLFYVALLHNLLEMVEFRSSLRVTLKKTDLETSWWSSKSRMRKWRDW